MYDKKNHRFILASIKSVVQEEGFYSEETERMLNELIEGPANQVLQKLRRRNQIDETERSKLALYIGTMLMRAPRRRRKGFEVLPRVIEETISRVSLLVSQWAETATADPELIARRFAEIQQARDEYQVSPPPEIIERLRTPWASDRVLAVLSALTWRIFPSVGDSQFLTSDNPAWFAEALGIGSADSELVFPLASDLALHASWQGEPHDASWRPGRPSSEKSIGV